MSTLLRSAGALALAGAACAGEAPPPAVAALVDISRSSAPPAIADRIRFVIDGLIPLTGPAARSTVLVGREPVAAERLDRVAFATRWSDYRRAFAQVLPPLAAPGAGRHLVVVAGDGLMEAVYAGMPDDHLAGLPADATRDQINERLSARTAADHAPLLRQAQPAWLLLDTAAAPEPSSLLGWIHAARPTEARLPLATLRLAPLLDALAAQGLRLPGAALPAATLEAGGGNGRLGLAFPEGTTDALLLINAAGDQPTWTMSIAEEDAQGRPVTGSALQVEWIDGDGVARIARLRGLDAGMRVALRADGARQDYEIAGASRRAIVHTMAVQPDADTDFLFAGDTARIVHRFVRGPGETPVSAALAAALLRDGQLSLGDQPLAKRDEVVLPAAAGSATLAFLPRLAGERSGEAEPADFVRSQPLPLTWIAAGPLRLAGGFVPARAYDGDPVELRFTQSGGKRQVLSAAIAIAQGGATKAVMVSAAEAKRAIGAAAAPPPVLVGSVVFAEHERGAWSIDPGQRIAGRREAGGVAADPAGALHQQVEIAKNWWPLILALCGLAALLIAGWLAWWLTRPRWRGEVFQHEGKLLPLRGCPGRRARDFSTGIPAFAGAATFQAVRGATVIAAVAPGAGLFFNGKPLAVGQDPVVLPPGTDIEVVQGGRRAHARFFASAEQAAAWKPEQAVIDLAAFDSEHVVLDGA